MCGIAGGIALSAGASPDRDLIERMSRALSHRGPDGAGTWVSPSGAAILAHRRLSVIDLETGQQPMAAPDNSSCLVFNGEIYNYLELKDRLSSRGSVFRTTSDTEVLLELLRSCGVGAVSETVGMFAFAYWDDRRRTLLLARDRVGKKPLFYTVSNQCLYFCSTLRGLEATFAASLPICAASVVNFLDVGYIPAPTTIFDGVSKLPAATHLQVSQDRPVPETTCYWNPIRSVAEEPSTEAQALDHLEALLEDAVRLRLRSDVPLGVFLSGGIDSSLIAALSAKMSGHPMQTFTIGFDVGEYDESGKARRIAQHLGTDHQEFRLQSSLLELLPEALEHFGEPFADSAALPLWYLAREARKEVTVALLGDGGDEGFGGYDWYRKAMKLNRGAQLFGHPFMRRITQLAARPFGRKARRLAHLLATSPAKRFADLRCMFAPHTGPDVLNRDVLARTDPAGLIRDRIAALYSESGAHASLRMQYADLKTYLADGLLPKVDVATMAHGLEARAPLLDHRILEFAYGLPPRLNDPSNPKQLLKKLLARHVPPELTQGPKMGFTVPLRDWFRGELAPAVLALSSGAVVEHGYVRPGPVAGIVREHMTGKRDNSERLFHLFVLDSWLSR